MHALLFGHSTNRWLVVSCLKLNCLVQRPATGTVSDLCKWSEKSSNCKRHNYRGWCTRIRSSPELAFLCPSLVCHVGDHQVMNLMTLCSLHTGNLLSEMRIMFSILSPEQQALISSFLLVSYQANRGENIERSWSNILALSSFAKSRDPPPKSSFPKKNNILSFLLELEAQFYKDVSRIAWKSWGVSKWAHHWF